MELALISIRQIATMFIIIFIGIICSKAGIITEKGNKTLSAVVLNVVNPAVIFMSYQVDFDKELLKGLGIAVGLSAITFLTAIIISNLVILRKNNKDFNIERIGLVYSNCGFIGIPIINALIGSQGVFYLAAYLTIFNVLLWTHGVILMTGVADLKAAGKALMTPCIIAIALGVVFFVFGIRLPGFISDAVEFIGSMNTPLAMLVAGATIAGTNMLAVLKKIRIYFIILLKLFVIPLIIVAIMIPFAGMGIEKNIIMTIIIATACPTGASGVLFALRYEGNALYASEIFGITTFLSAVSIPLIMLLTDLLIG